MILVGMTLVMSCVTADHDGHYVETFSDDLDNDVHVESFHADDVVDNILIREKRSADNVCKYKKGDWSQCDKLVMLITRKDTLKEKNSGPACDKVRTITKNCKEREQEKEKGVCVFEKPKNVAWSSCKESGVRQRTLRLLKRPPTSFKKALKNDPKQAQT